MAENKLENSLKIAIGQSVNKYFEAVDITPENIMIEDSWILLMVIILLTLQCS